MSVQTDRINTETIQVNDEDAPKPDEDLSKSEWEGIIIEAIATMIYVFVCCGVVASTANVTFDELNSPRLVVISLARKFAFFVLCVCGGFYVGMNQQLIRCTIFRWSLLLSSSPSSSSSSSFSPHQQLNHFKIAPHLPPLPPQ